MKKKFTFLTIAVLSSFFSCAQPFTLPSLPYAYDALEPYFDEQTMTIHHTKHHASYVNNLNTAVAATIALKGKTIEEILTSIDKYSPAVRNNAGGHYNHSLFWTLLTPKADSLPKGPLMNEITKTFGSFEAFKTQFADSAKTRFGSGWAWLIITKEGKLKITSTANQDNPLMSVVKEKGTPILALDVWEHAYYLKYQNKRPDYITAFWKIINWTEVQKRYQAAK